MTVSSEGESKLPNPGLYLFGEQYKPPQSVHQWKVICLNLKTGNVLWDKTVHEGLPETSTHVRTPTPPKPL